MKDALHCLFLEIVYAIRSFRSIRKTGFIMNKLLKILRPILNGIINILAFKRFASLTSIKTSHIICRVSNET